MKTVPPATAARRHDPRPVFTLAVVLAAALIALWIGGGQPFGVVLAAGAGLIDASTRISGGRAEPGHETGV